MQSAGALAGCGSALHTWRMLTPKGQLTLESDNGAGEGLSLEVAWLPLSQSDDLLLQCLSQASISEASRALSGLGAEVTTEITAHPPSLLTEAFIGGYVFMGKESPS